jgi:hypothetical protein
MGRRDANPSSLPDSNPSKRLNAERLLEAIRNITEETGYPPSADELAEVFDIRMIQSSRAWRDLMGAGRIAYGDGSVVVIR